MSFNQQVWEERVIAAYSGKVKGNLKNSPQQEVARYSVVRGLCWGAV